MRVVTPYEESVMIIRRPACTVFLSLLASVALEAGQKSPGEEKVTLRQKFHKGMTSRMTMTMDMSMEMRTTGSNRADMPENIQAKIQQTQETLLRVTNVDTDGVTTLEMTFERMRQVMDMGERKIVLDSKEDPQTTDSMSQALSAAFKPLIGHTIVITFDRDQKAVEVKGMDEMWKAFGEDVKGLAMRKQMEKMFGDRQIQKMMEQCLARNLPKQPVAVGEKWISNDQMDIPIMGSVRVKTACTLAGIEQYKGRQCAKILMSAQMAPAETQPGSRPHGLPMGMKIKKSDSKGVQWFDIEAGELVELDIDQDTRIVMDMPALLGESEGPTSRPASRPSMEQHLWGKMRMTVTPEPTTKPQ